MVARDRPYSELLDSLRGKKVVIWTCNTCVKICFDIGGTGSAERLAAALRKDGIDVLGVFHTSASCIEEKVRGKYDEEVFGSADVVLSLTCSIGALCAKRVFDEDVLNPVATVGVGFVSEDGTIFVCVENGKGITVRKLTEAAEEKGLLCSPYA